MSCFWLIHRLKTIVEPPNIGHQTSAYPESPTAMPFVGHQPAGGPTQVLKMHKAGLKDKVDARYRLE